MWEDIFIAKLSNSGTGINLEDDNGLLSIFPNPSSEFMNINFQKNISKKHTNCFTIFFIKSQKKTPRRPNEISC
jgi:hypothetical protein